MADTYYTVLGDPPVTVDRYFRVTDDGIYSRFDAATRTWVEVLGAGRDGLSRRIESGDDIVRSTPDEIAALTD